MAEVLQPNQWVDYYITAALSHGLSSEYVRQDTMQNADYSVAHYFVDFLKKDDTDSVMQAWRRARTAARLEGVDPLEVRRENRAWRIWSYQHLLKRRQLDAGGEEPEEAGHGGLEPAMSEALDTMSVDEFSSSLDTARLDTGRTAIVPPVASSGPLGVQLRMGSFTGQMDRGLAPLKTASVDMDGDLLVSPGHPMSARSAMSDTLPEHNPFKGRVEKLYVVLISLHGLVRGHNMELGKDADTGGQVKYVVELARTLGHHPLVHRVDLLTRLITADGVGPDYGREEEELLRGSGTHGGAYIVRLRAGNPNVYYPKEQLWPYLREFADHGLEHVRRMQRVMLEAREPASLYCIHGHYADAGEVAAKMAHTLDVPMVLTGHSLGRNKLEHLLRGGRMSMREIEATYAIHRRIEGEERAVDAALIVITSTQQEIDQQWGLYDGYSPQLARHKELNIRRRSSARAVPVMHVIPPGLDFSALKVELEENPMDLFDKYRRQLEPAEGPWVASGTVPRIPAGPGPEEFDDLEGLEEEDAGEAERPKPSSLGHSSLLHQASLKSSARAPGALSKGASFVSLTGLDAPEKPEIWQAVHRFLQNPVKPIVLAMSRPDAKKNIVTLVRAFGENATLRELANLVLIMGNRSDIDELATGSQSVITEVLKLIDRYDLYGSVAYPKAHKQSDISDIYLLAKSTKGVFVNIALQEPFGLTLIEAAAHGVPIVATRHGGPVDIVRTLKNGRIVEPTDAAEVGRQILDIIISKDAWSRFSTRGRKNILAYSWPSHCLKYLKEVEMLLQSEKSLTRPISKAQCRSTADHIGDMAGPEINPVGWDADEDARQGAHSVNALLPADVHMGHAPFAASVSGAQDDLSVNFTPTASHRATLRHAGARIHTRRRLVYATLDSTFDVPFFAQALRAALLVNDGSLAVGVLSVLTRTEVCAELQRAGLEPTDLDFLVCNCGAYIMYMDDAGSWLSDERWESKVSHRWDKQLMMRELTRMRMQPRHVVEEGGAAKVSDVVRALQQDDGCDVNDGNGPLHVMLAFQPQEGSPLEAFDNEMLRQRFLKGMRRKGLRGNLTLVLSPEETGQSVLHATPLRASRGLALRHIVSEHEHLSMASAVYLCTPPAVVHKSEKQDFTTLGALCSDVAPLIEGAQKVVVVPPSRRMRISQSLDDVDIDFKDGRRVVAAFQRMKVTLQPFEEERVIVLRVGDGIETTLKGLLVQSD